MISELKIRGAFVFTPKQFGDDRGVFLEWFKSDGFAEAAGHQLDLQQANMSVSAAGVLRGIHFADVPPGQAKYVMCPKGAVFDVVVDIRVGSPTFGQWVGEVLSADNKRQLWIPPGFAHGFLVLSDIAEFLYKTTEYYAPECEGSFLWNDPAVGIAWPLVGDPVLSTKDANSGLLRRT